MHEHILRFRLSLDVDEVGHGHDEWFEIARMDSPEQFIEECISDYLEHHWPRAREIAGLGMHISFSDVEPWRYSEFVDVTYEYEGSE